MAFKIDMSKGIINEGSPTCKHHEIIANDDSNHQIGTCACGRVVDYTQLQSQLPGVSGVYTGTAGGYKGKCSFDRLVQYQRGLTEALKEKRNVNKRMVNQ
jgi:hypothetical protein